MLCVLHRGVAALSPHIFRDACHTYKCPVGFPHKVQLPSQLRAEPRQGEQHFRAQGSKINLRFPPGIPTEIRGRPSCSANQLFIFVGVPDFRKSCLLLFQGLPLFVAILSSDSTREDSCGWVSNLAKQTIFCVI